MSCASLTVRASGIFDELYVRSPPKVGPYVLVLSLGGSVELDEKRDVSDSYSRAETTSFIAASGYSEAEAYALFQTVASAASSLLLKRDVSDSLSTNEVNGLLGAKVDDSVHQSALSLKRDKEGRLSSVQTANLYQTKVDTVTALALKRDIATSLSAVDVAAALALKRDVATSVSAAEVATALSLKRDVATSLSAVQVAAGLGLKRNIADSLSTTEIQTLAAAARPISSITGLQGELDNRAGSSATVSALSFKVDKEGSISESESNANLLARVQTPVPATALFTDTVYSPSDVTHGSLEISHVAQLTAVLQSMQSAQDSDTADTLLRNSIT